MKFNIVLVEPEIPQNTGNIVRTCAATGSVLHLVRPLGFEVTDKHLKRAGLDYWYLTDIRYYDSIEEVMEKYYNGNNFYFLSTKAKRIYSEAQFKKSIIMSLIIYRKAYTPYKEKNKKYIRRNLEKRNVCKKQIYNVDSSKKR